MRFGAATPAPLPRFGVPSGGRLFHPIGRIALALLVPALLAGCRTDPNISLLQRELRLKEDQIYQLQDSIQDAQDEVESCRRENAFLRKRLDEGKDDMPGSALMDSIRGARGGRGGREDRPLPPEAVMTPPSVAVPSEALPPNVVPETLQPRSHEPRSSAPPAAPESVPAPQGQYNPQDPGLSGPRLSAMGQNLPAEPPEEAADADGSSRGMDGALLAGSGAKVVAGESSSVQRITLNRLLTGGYKGRDSRDSEGMLIVLEPRDAEGRIVLAPADVSVVVVDPAMRGAAARIARWDFSANEIARMLGSKGIGPGIQIEQAWPSATPQHNALHLFVRYTTNDGRRLQVDQAISAQLSSRQTPKWTSTNPQPSSDGPDLQASRRGAPWQHAPTGIAVGRDAADAPAATATADARSDVSAAPARQQADRANRDGSSSAAGATNAATDSDRRGGRSAAVASEALARPVWSPERR